MSFSISQNELVLGWNQDHTYILAISFRSGDYSLSSSERRIGISSYVRAVTPFSSLNDTTETIIKSEITWHSSASSYAVPFTKNSSITFGSYSSSTYVGMLSYMYYDNVYIGNGYISYDIETASGQWKGSVTVAEFSMARQAIPTFSINGTDNSKSQYLESTVEFGDTLHVTVPAMSKTFRYVLEVSVNPGADGGGSFVLADDLSGGGESRDCVLPIDASRYMSASATSGYLSMRLYLYQGELIDNADVKSAFFLRYTGTPILAQVKIPDRVVPVISDITITEGTPGFPDAVENFVQQKSRLKVNINASALYGASLSSIVSTCSGSTYRGTSITTNPLTASGSVTLSVTVTDSRGRSRKETRTVTVLPYAPPRITGAALYRCHGSMDAAEDKEGAFACIRPAGEVASLNGQNTIICKAFYKRVGETSYRSVRIACADYALDTEHQIFAADIGSGYEVYLTLTDVFGEETRFHCAPLPATGALLHVKKNRKGIGIFQRVPSGKDGVWIAGDVHLTGMQHENSTVEAVTLSQDLHNYAAKQYQASESGTEKVVPLFTVRTASGYVTLCVDTEKNSAGVHFYNEESGETTYTRIGGIEELPEEA